MLYEPGPIDPVDVDRWTQPGPLTRLAADAAALAGQLGTAGAAIGSLHSDLALAGPPRMELDAGLDLAAAAAAHDSQAREVDNAVAGIAGNADVQTSDLATLMSETAADIAAGEPGFPDFVEHPNPSTGPIGEAPEPSPGEPSPPPGGTVADLITAYYQKYLRRDPGLEGINAWAPLWPNQDAIEHGILFSGEYADKVNGLYHQYFDRDVAGDELAGARAQHWGLDDVEADLRERA
jgi:hypothetical protein